MRKPLTIAVAVLATAACHAHANVIYSNFGPGDAYNSEDGGQFIGYGGPAFGITHEAAVAFTVTGGSFYLTSAEFAVIHSWGPDIVYANIHADSDNAPGAILDSSSATGLQYGYDWAPPMTATFSGGVLLEEGKQYWLALKSEETDAALAWAMNATGDTGLSAFQQNGAGWNTFDSDPTPRSVFRINGSLVPTPGAIALVAMAGFVSRRRRS